MKKKSAPASKLKPQLKSQSKSKRQVKAKAPSKPKTKPKIKARSKMMKAASHIRRTTKKMVDDVFLRLVGRRVLERAEEVSRSLELEKKGKKSKS